MIYVLRTGIQWNALPREMGASSTVHARFQEWEWQAVDGVMTKAPLGRGASGPNPLIRPRKG
jgi:putative transposase